MTFPANLTPTPLDIKGAGRTLLSTLEAVLTQMGIELPDLRGVVPGALVAFDGAQLTVNFVNITRGVGPTPDPGYMEPQSLVQWYNFEINFLREVASLQQDGGGSVDINNAIPSMDELGTDYDTLAVDAAALWAALVTIHANALIVPINIPFLYGPLGSVGPEGGLAGSRLPVIWQAL